MLVSTIMMTACIQVQDLGYETDAAISDALVDAAALDSGNPGALLPHPPMGATRCGQGVFSAADATATCVSPGTCITQAIPMIPNTTTRCDAVTTTGGAWEAWCTTTSVYLWTRFDGVEPTGNLMACPGTTALLFPGGIDDFAEVGNEMCSGQPSIGAYLPDGSPLLTVDVGQPATVIVESGAPGFLQGTGKLMFAVAGACSQTAFYVAGGAALSW